MRNFTHKYLNQNRLIYLILFAALLLIGSIWYHFTQTVNNTNLSNSVQTEQFYTTIEESPELVTTKEGHPFVVSGVLVNDGSNQMLTQFVEYLSERTKYPLYLKYAINYQKLTDVLRDDPNAIAWTCGAPFVEDKDQYGQQLVSVPLFNGIPTYSSIILTKRDRQEKHLEDFKDQVFAYSDLRSNSGYLSPAVILKRQGIDINGHFRLMINAGNHETSIISLLSGLADVAAVDEYVWVEYRKKYPESGEVLHEIERMGPYPFTPIVAGKATRKEVIENFMQILTQMDADKEGQRILLQFGLDGFVVKSPSFYEPIRKMLEEVQQVGENL